MIILKRVNALLFMSVFVFFSYQVNAHFDEASARILVEEAGFRPNGIEGRRVIKEFQWLEEKGILSLEDIEVVGMQAFAMKLRTGKIRVTFPKDYPFRPFSIKKLSVQEGGNGKSLRSLINVPFYKSRSDREDWSPKFTLVDLLELQAADDTELPSFLADIQIPVDGGVAYISIGSGGPVVRQKYPPFIQQQFKAGKYVVLLMVDPFLTLTEKSSISVGDQYTLAYFNGPIYKDEGPVLGAFVEKLRKHNFAVYLDDFRDGGDFGGISFPVKLPGTSTAYLLERESRLVSDPIIENIVSQTMTVAIDDDVMNVDGIFSRGAGGRSLKDIVPQSCRTCVSHTKD